MGKSIDDYRAKRDFKKTPEPEPGKLPAREGAAVFVVHRHEARRLHYDLRLEMEGVLRSWAVPRGFSYDPKDKHLAVRTEDHPLEYLDFDGVIPKGEYGAGTMTIWDKGRYEVAKDEDGASAVGKGELKIHLRGRRLRGEWHLVRTSKEEGHWLLFKARDRYARGEGDFAPSVDLTAAVEAPFLERVRVMHPKESFSPFSDPEWIFEMEFDGERVLSAKREDEVTLRTTSGRKLTGRFPRIVEELAQVRAENALIDGVLVALDPGGRPSREKLEEALTNGADDDVTLYVFDLLYYEEWDMRGLPALDRKAVLASLLAKPKRVLYVDHVAGSGENLVEAVAAAGLKSVIAKQTNSRYVAGRSPSWRRIEVAPAEAAAELEFGEALAKSTAERKTTRARFKISNLGKTYWPKEGYTKGDLIGFYEQVAEVLLPYLHERPVHMLRYPDGIEGKYFYQRQAPEHLPAWIETEVISASSKEEAYRHMICNDRESLLYLVNLGSIDLHPWLSHRPSLDSPDWAILDLDAKQSTFPDVVKVARSIGKLLRGIGLRPYVKTSGKTGIHVYVPLEPGYTYDHTRMFCETVARIVAREHEDIATVERQPHQRGRRVYVDFLQNRRAQTVVPPYVPRPVEGAPVSMPLDWDELDSELSPLNFTIRTALPRLAQRGDLFRGVLTDKQDLLAAISALQEYFKA